MNFFSPTKTSSSSTNAMPVMKSLLDREYEMMKRFDSVFGQDLDLFDSTWGTAFSPTLDVQEFKDKYHVEADFPGVEKKDVKISLKNDCLIIEGEKKPLMKRNERIIDRSKELMELFIALLLCQKMLIKKKSMQKCETAF